MEPEVNIVLALESRGESGGRAAVCCIGISLMCIRAGWVSGRSGETEHMSPFPLNPRRRCDRRPARGIDAAAPAPRRRHACVGPRRRRDVLRTRRPLVRRRRRPLSVGTTRSDLSERLRRSGLCPQVLHSERVRRSGLCPHVLREAQDRCRIKSGARFKHPTTDAIQPRRAPSRTGRPSRRPRVLVAGCSRSRSPL